MFKSTLAWSSVPSKARPLFGGIFLSLTLLFAVATVEDGPPSPKDAFSWSKTQAPATATGIQYYGETGMDRMVQIGFYLNTMSEVQQYTQSFQCPTKPITKRIENPFSYSSPGKPPWWRSGAAPENSIYCKTQSPDFSRQVRIEPEGTRFWVQIQAFTL